MTPLHALLSSSKLRRTLTWRRLHPFFVSFSSSCNLSRALLGCRMDAPARGLIHKRVCLTSVTGRLDQSGGGTGDARRAGRGRTRSHFIQKMRHLRRPSHCGSLLHTVSRQQIPPRANIFFYQSRQRPCLNGKLSFSVGKGAHRC